MSFPSPELHYNAGGTSPDAVYARMRTEGYELVPIRPTLSMEGQFRTVDCSPLPSLPNRRRSGTTHPERN